MKITGILTCFLLLAAASARADSLSFRDHYFKNWMPEARGSSPQRGAHTADWDPNTWTFSAVNEGPSRFLSQINPQQRSEKPVAVAKTAKASRPASVLPFVRPDETIDYKLSVRKPKEGVEYKLKVMPRDSAVTLR